MIVKKSFYQKNTLEVAQELLGCFLIRKIRQKTIKALITETEAYCGEKDLANHASKGRTLRTELMFGEAGHAYIYLIYGMYYCLNIVTEKKDYPAAVLIRAVKIDGVNYKKTNGSGKVCRELKIDKKLNGWDVTKGEKIWIEKPAQNFSKKNIMAGKRIGVDYAKHCKKYLWRFYFSKS
jgi:DNA-3-methyladenine glycosylase